MGSQREATAILRAVRDIGLIGIVLNIILAPLLYVVVFANIWWTAVHDVRFGRGRITRRIHAWPFLVLGLVAFCWLYLYGIYG